MHRRNARSAKVQPITPGVVPPGGEQPDHEQSLREEARFLHWFGQDTIAFNRGYVEITGHVVTALWLSFVLETMPFEVRAGRASLTEDRYRFTMTGTECEEATGITRAQQAGCRRQLVALGLLEVVATRGKTVTYIVNLDRLREIMTEHALPLLSALRAARQAPLSLPVAAHGR
jgi:hypothetical protein